MSDLVISKVNEVYLKIQTEPHIDYELRDRFTFEVPNKKFMPQYRNKYWDGYVHLYNLKTKRIYVGLLDKIIAFCENSGYTYQFENNKYYGLPFEYNEMVSKEGVKDYIKSITKFKARDYQIDAVYDALKYNRKLILIRFILVGYTGFEPVTSCLSSKYSKPTELISLFIKIIKI